MQKDERAAVTDYSSGRAGPEYLFTQMQSIFIQRNLGSIPNDVWPIFLHDFCNVLTHENFKRAWEDLAKAGNAAFSDDFIAFMARIADPNSIECKQRAKQ
jgi:hypothetical protein